MHCESRRWEAIREEQENQNTGKWGEGTSGANVVKVHCAQELGHHKETIILYNWVHL